MTHFVVLVAVPNEDIGDRLETVLEQTLEHWREGREVEPYKDYLSPRDIGGFFNFYTSSDYHTLKVLKEMEYDTTDLPRANILDASESKEDKVKRLLKDIETKEGKDRYYEILDLVRKSMTDVDSLTIFEFFEKFQDDWSGAVHGIDEKGIYHWNDYNPDSRWDWFCVGGRWEKTFPTITPITTDMNRDSIKFDVHEYDTILGGEGEVIGRQYPSDIVANGKWLEQHTMGWWACHTESMPFEEWNKKVDDVLDTHMGTHTLVAVDCHI